MISSLPSVLILFRYSIMKHFPTASALGSTTHYHRNSSAIVILILDYLKPDGFINDLFSGHPLLYFTESRGVTLALAGWLAGWLAVEESSDRPTDRPSSIKSVKAGN